MTSAADGFYKKNEPTFAID